LGVVNTSHSLNAAIEALREGNPEAMRAAIEAH
jgi:hypothetical protein